MMRSLALALTALAVSLPAWADGKVETGSLNGADFRVDFPANPNGDLIVYCHGYGGARKFDPNKPLTGALAALVAKGYTVAQSGYSADGWAMKEGMEDSEALRQYFEKKYGKPKHTWITGHSMGGSITTAIIEAYPQHYDGALPMCAPMGSSLPTLRRMVFDTLAVYEYYFPDMLVSAADPIEADEELPIRIQKEASAYPDRMEAFQRWSGLRNDVEVGRTVAFLSQLQREFVRRAGGNPFDNRDTLYQGSTDDGRLNRGVKRYAADPKAAEYVRQRFPLNGQLKRPMISIHTVYDPLVPAWAANAYGELTQTTGASDLYVQRFVSRSGHCAIQPEEMVHAMEDLAKWRESGKRPASGEQK